MKFFVSFCVRHSVQETFLVEVRPLNFTGYLEFEEAEISDQVLSYYMGEGLPSGKSLDRVSAIVEATSNRDYWGEVDIDFDILEICISPPPNWGELRQVWLDCLHDAGVLSEYHINNAIGRQSWLNFE